MIRFVIDRIIWAVCSAYGILPGDIILILDKLAKFIENTTQMYSKQPNLAKPGGRFSRIIPKIILGGTTISTMIAGKTVPSLIVGTNVLIPVIPTTCV